MRAEAERACRRLAAVPDFLVDAVTERALSPTNSVLLTVLPAIDEPPELRRADGSSVYEVAGSRRYTSAAILDAERRILGEAACQDFRVIDSDAVDAGVAGSRSRTASALGPDQAEMVRQLATSGARVQLALAPAGSGKTITLRTLAEAWAADGNTVIGLAPTAAAARVLRDELGDSVTATDTLAKLVHALTTGTAVPDWVDAIGPGSLVIVDEAGMAGTLELAAVDRATPLAAARQCGSSVTTGNSPPSAPAACCATSTAPTARSRYPRYAASPTPTAARTAPKPPPRWRSAAASPPDSGTTSTTAASTSATTRPPPIRPSPPGRPTVLPASTRSSSRPPANRSGS